MLEELRVRSSESNSTEKKCYVVSNVKQVCEYVKQPMVDMRSVAL